MYPTYLFMLFTGDEIIDKIIIVLCIITIVVPWVPSTLEV